MIAFFRKLFSIGKLRWRKAKPFITGKIDGLLPRECWSPNFENEMKYRIHEDVWTGFRWKYVRTLEMTKQELKHYHETEIRL